MPATARTAVTWSGRKVSTIPAGSQAKTTKALEDTSSGRAPPKSCSSQSVPPHPAVAISGTRAAAGNTMTAQISRKTQRARRSAPEIRVAASSSTSTGTANAEIPTRYGSGAAWVSSPTVIVTAAPAAAAPTAGQVIRSDITGRTIASRATVASAAEASPTTTATTVTGQRYGAPPPKRRRPASGCWRLGRGRVELVRALAVHHGVDAGDLVLVLDPEAHRLLDDPADDEGQHEAVDNHAEGTERLLAQLGEAARVDQADAGAEEADVQRSDETAHEVDAHDIERVVEARLVLQLDRQGTDRAGDQAEHDGPERRQDVTGRGDRDQARDGARCGPDRGGLAVLDLLHDQPAERGSSRSGEGVDPGDRGDAVDGGLGTGVEPEPAEPQHRGADERQRHVVRLVHALLEADAATEHQRQRETRGTGVDVDRRSTGEVVDADDVSEEAVTEVEDRVADREVDH